MIGQSYLDKTVFTLPFATNRVNFEYFDIDTEQDESPMYRTSGSQTTDCSHDTESCALPRRKYRVLESIEDNAVHE